MARSALLGAAPLTGRSAVVRSTYYRVRDVTADIDLPYALLPSCSHGWDMRIATAEVHFPEIPEGTHYGDVIEITMGATEETAVVRFTGFLVTYQRRPWPRDIVMVLRGGLMLADEIDNTAPNGTDFTSAGAGATDQAIVGGVLDAVGISGYDVDGTGLTMGQKATLDWAWGNGESALSYIERIDQISVLNNGDGTYSAYRTFDTPSGVVTRKAVSTIPPEDPTFVATFTEGVDITKDASSEHSILPTRNRVVVEGWTPAGGTFAPYVNVQQVTNASIPDPPGYLTFQLSSRLIERQLASDSGGGVSCEDVANWYLIEYQHQAVKMVIPTPRDDLILPGDVIAVVAPDRLAVNTAAVVQHVDVGIDSKGAFRQTLTCISGPEG